MSYHSIEQVLQELEDDLLVVAMVPAALMDFVDESNIDEAIAALPEDSRLFVLDWARDVVFADESQLLHIAGVSNLRAIRPEDKRNPRRDIFFNALRTWLAKHPR
jgi:hypothetical protein